MTRKSYSLQIFETSFNLSSYKHSHKCMPFEKNSKFIILCALLASCRRRLNVWRNANFFSISFYFCHDLGGNQRALAREKAQKKQKEQQKGNRPDNLTVDQRKAR